MSKLLPKDCTSLKKHVEEIENLNIRPEEDRPNNSANNITKPKLTSKLLEKKPSALSVAVEDA